MQETVEVRDDAYDIPDRTVVASVDPVPETPAQKPSDDYYNEQEASNYQQGSYYDRTYNDPSWYNRDRFGFGYNSSPWGSSWNMSYGTGWGNNSWYNSPTGWYNPYWGNSWQSGYGYYSPWNGGMYDPWGWNSGWGGGYGCGNSWGWNSPYGWGNNWGNSGYYGYGGYGGGYGYPYTGYGYGGYGGYGGYWPGSDYGTSYIVSHRPSMSGGGNPGGANVSTVPRATRPRNDISLLRPPTVPKEHKARFDPARSTTRDNGQTAPQRQQPDRKERKERKERVVRPDRPRERERVSDPTPRLDRQDNGGSRGGGGGSSPSPSPRPRR